MYGGHSFVGELEENRHGCDWRPKQDTDIVN